MKKTLIAAAALTATATWAQSGVSISGVLDAQVQRIINDGTGDTTRLHSGGLGASRLNIAGREDLGSGLFASFVLEGQINADTGTGAASNTNNQTSGVTPPAGGSQGLTFNRRSTVSLSSTQWGELRLGREIAPGSINMQVYDPFRNSGLGSVQGFVSIITGPAAYRTSNNVHYVLPDRLGGFFGDLAIYMGENASNAVAGGLSIKDDGNGEALRFGYRNRAFDVAVNHSKTRYAAGDAEQLNVGGIWKLGAIDLHGYLSRDKRGTTDADGWLAAGVVRIQPSGTLQLSLSQYDVQAATGTEQKSRKIALGYIHSLSKRTSLYSTIAHVDNSGGAAAPIMMGAAAPIANGNSRGVEFGLRHQF